MTPNLTWNEIALRLALTFGAAALIGINRGEHARPAGLRTILLVCLAASLSMIQVNLLLDMHGRASDSFVMLDLMRLPLGILSGMGFIGAGAILRKDNLVVGVTTAATLWYVTVMGLCFGGGQIGLGLAALVLGIVILWCLKWVEQHCIQDRRGTLTITVSTDGPKEGDLSRLLQADGFKIHSWALNFNKTAAERQYKCEILWRDRLINTGLPPFIKRLAEESGVNGLDWKPS